MNINSTNNICNLPTPVKKYLYLLNKKQIIFILINFIISVLLIILQLYFVNSFSNFLLFFNILIITAYFICSTYIIIKNTQLKIVNQKLQEYQLYNKSLSILHDNIRCFKHDFYNIVQAIGGYVQTEDMKGLQKYYKQLLDECNFSTNLSLLNPQTINNPAIFNVLCSKYHNANMKNINFNISVFLDLNQLNMKIYEFTKIMGILLDNAIEATFECDEKLINFTIRNDNPNNRQLLIIENTYMNKDIDTEKIYQKAYTTKPNNTGLRFVGSSKYSK